MEILLVDSFRDLKLQESCSSYEQTWTRWGKKRHNISKDIDYLNNTIKPPTSIGIHRMLHLKTAEYTAFEHKQNF